MSARLRPALKIWPGCGGGGFQGVLGRFDQGSDAAGEFGRLERLAPGLDARRDRGQLVDQLRSLADGERDDQEADADDGGEEGDVDHQDRPAATHGQMATQPVHERLQGRRQEQREEDQQQDLRRPDQGLRNGQHDQPARHQADAAREPPDGQGCGRS